MEQLGGLLARIAHRNEVDMPPGEKILVRLAILVDAHAQDHQIRLIVVQLEQGRQLHQARLAPRSPEVHQHHLPAVVI